MRKDEEQRARSPMVATAVAEEKPSPTNSCSDASSSSINAPVGGPRGRKRKEDKFLKTYAKSPKKDSKVCCYVIDLFFI